MLLTYLTQGGPIRVPIMNIYPLYTRTIAGSSAKYQFSWLGSEPHHPRSTFQSLESMYLSHLNQKTFNES